MTEIPDVYMDLLLEKRAFAHLATVMPDGSPQNTPVWFDFIDGKVRVNSALGRTKVRNRKMGAKVALSIMDPDNPDRYVQLRGTVSRVRQDDVAAAHIDQLAHKYLGLDKNPYAKAGDVRNLRVLRLGDELISFWIAWPRRPTAESPRLPACLPPACRRSPGSGRASWLVPSSRRRAARR